jgi:hypothetical protein
MMARQSQSPPPIADLQIEAGTRTFRIHQPAAELLDVGFPDPLTERHDPMFGPTILDAVSKSC